MTDITKDERERALEDARRITAGPAFIVPSVIEIHTLTRVLLSEAKRAEELEAELSALIQDNTTLVQAATDEANEVATLTARIEQLKAAL